VVQKRANTQREVKVCIGAAITEVNPETLKIEKREEGAAVESLDQPARAPGYAKNKQKGEHGH